MHLDLVLALLSLLYICAMVKWRLSTYARIVGFFMGSGGPTYVCSYHIHKVHFFLFLGQEHLLIKIS